MLYKSVNKFKEVIDETKRVMCLDFGERKIGIAFK